MTPTIFSRAKSLILILALAFALMPATGAHAAEFLSVQNGDWNNPATWGGAEIPTAADSVTIANPHTVTITADAEALNVTVNNGGTLNGGSSMLTIYGVFTVNGNFSADSGTIRYGGAGAQDVIAASYYNLTLSGGGTKSLKTSNIYGALTVESGATFEIPAATIAVDGATTVKNGGTLNITNATGTKTFNGDVIIESGGAWNNTAEAVEFGGSLENNGTFNAGTAIQTFSGTGEAFGGTLGIPSVTITGSYTNNGTLTVSTALAGAGSLTQGSNSTLTIGATSTISTLDASTNVNTVTYAGAAQTVKPVAYYHLTLSGSGAKTLTNVSTINGNLTFGGAATGVAATNMTIGGNLTLDSSATTPFSVGAHNITVSGTTTLTDGKLDYTSATGVKTFHGDVVIGADGTWEESNLVIAFNFGGSFINNGTLSQMGTGAHTFTGTGNIGGTNAVTIPNVAINGSYTNTSSLTATTLSGSGSLTQAENSTLTLSGDVSLTGLDASAAGNTVSYTKSGGQAVISSTYQNLTLSGTGTNVKTFSALTVNGTLTMQGTATASGAVNYGPNAALVYNNATMVGSEWTSTFSSSGGVTSSGTSALTLDAAKVLNAPLTLTGTSFNTGGFNMTVNSNMTTSGTFTGGSSVVAVSGNLAHTAGTFNANSMTLNVGGDFSNSGTFKGNSMTLTVSGDFANASTFEANTMTLNVSGNFSHNAGTFTANSMTLTVGGHFQNNATFTATASPAATLKLSGDFINNGTIGGTPTFSMIFEGANDQSVSGFTTTGALTMQKSGGTATLNGNMTVGATSYTNQVLIINGAGGTLHLGNGLTHTIRGTWVRTAGTVDGGSSAILLQGTTPVSGSGGAFLPGTSTVNYNGNATYALANLPYYNLTVSRRTTTSTWTRTLSGDLTVLGEFTSGSGVYMEVGAFNFTVEGPTNVVGTFRHTSATGTKTYKGLVTVSGTWTNSANANITFQNGLVNTGTFTVGTGIHTFSVNNQDINSNKAITLTSVVVNGVTLTNNITTSTGLTISASLGGSGTLAQGENAVLVLGGTSAISGFDASASGNTVTYNMAGAQVLKPGVYHNLTLSGGGNKPLTGISTINGKLTISGVKAIPAVTATGTNLTVGSIDLGAYSTVTVGNHNLIVNGAVDIRNTATLAQSFAPARSKQFGGMVTVFSGGTWTNSDNRNTFLSGLSNSGTFNAGIEEYSFTTNDQTIGGTKAIILFRLKVDGVTVTNTNTVGITFSTGGEIATINGGAWLQGVNSILSVGIPNISGLTIDVSTHLNTVNYSMAGPQTLTPVAYHHLTLSGSGEKTLTGLTTVNGNLTFAGATTTTVPSTLTTIGGNLVLNNTAIATLTNALTVNGTVTVSASSAAGKLDLGAHTLTVNGNWARGTGTIVTTGSVVFTGAGNNTLSGGGTSTFANLVINKTGDLKITATANPVVNGTLTLTRGTLTTQSRIMIIGKNGAISGGNASSYVIGNLRKVFTDDIGPQTFTFHLGDVNGYRPMTVTNLNVTNPDNDTGFITATVPATPIEHAQIGSSNIQQTKNVNRYWTLTTGNKITFTGAYSATFGFEDDHYDAGANPLGFVVKRYQNTTAPVGWSDSTVGSRSANSITASNFTSIGASSNFVVGELLGTNMSGVTLTPVKEPYKYEYGEAVTMSATLLTAGNAPLAGKPVVFEFDGRVVGTANTNSSGVATLNASILANVGENKTLTARYDGDGTQYGFSTAESAPFEVTKRTITLEATSASKVYDGSATAPTAPTLVSGTLATGDTLFQVFADKHVGSGKQMEPGVNDGNGGANYEITVNNLANTLGTITPKSLTITGVSAEDKTYDGTPDANLTGIPGLGGVVDGDTVTITGNPSTGSFVNKHAGAGKTVTPASDYTIDNANYIVTQPTFTASIAKADITLTAVTDTKVYDGTTSSDETPIVDDGTLMSGDTAFQIFDTRDVGTDKTLTPSVNDGNNGNNYNITANTVNNGVITKMTITVTPNDAIGYLHPVTNAPYPLTLTFTAVGFGAGDSFNSPGFTAPTCETDAEFNNANYPVIGSPYPDVISCSGGIVSDNYDLFLDPLDKSDLTVLERILLTITAQNQTITYGDAAPAYTFNPDGFEDGDDENSLTNPSSIPPTIPPTCIAGAGPFNAGSYPITCSGGENTKYAFDYVNGTLTVDKKMLTVTADPQTISDTLPAEYTFVYSGDFVNSDTAGDIDTPPTCAPSGAPYVVGVNAGKIVCSSGVDNNYAFNYLPGSLTIQTIVMTFVSSAAQDGWVLESGETTNKGGSINTKGTQFFVGDDAANKQYRGILSFNTSALPDNSVITAASLKLRYGGTVGGMTPTAMMTNFQGFQVDVKTGVFGKAGLEKADFQAKGTKTIASKPKLAKNYYTINLNTIRTSINKFATGSGLTQIRIRFKLDDNNNATANYLKLYSSNISNAAYKPQLIVTYHLVP